MPEGAQLTLGISPLLTNLAVGFAIDQTEFVADLIFPPVLVAAPSGTYPIWKRDDFLRTGGKKLANREAPPVVEFTTSKGNYNTSYWGVSANWTAIEVAEARVQGMSEQQLREMHTLNTTTKALLDREITVSSFVQTTGNWSATYGGVTSSASLGTSFLRWDLPASTPVDDVKYFKKQFKLRTGKKVNKIVLSEDVKDALLKNPQVLALWNPTFVGKDRPAVLNVAQLSEVLEIPNIVITESTYNSAPEGKAATFQTIWTNTVWMGYVAPKPAINEMSAGYSFIWSGDTSAGLPQGTEMGPGPSQWGAVKNNRGLYIRAYETVRPQARWVDCMKFDQPNVVSPDLGITLTDPIG